MRQVHCFAAATFDFLLSASHSGFWTTSIFELIDVYIICLVRSGYKSKMNKYIEINEYIHFQRHSQTRDNYEWNKNTHTHFMHVFDLSSQIALAISALSWSVNPLGMVYGMITNGPDLWSHLRSSWVIRSFNDSFPRMKLSDSSVRISPWKILGSLALLRTNSFTAVLSRNVLFCAFWKSRRDKVPRSSII